MLTNDEPQELAVDRREETLITQQPGYAATEQVVHDVAAERSVLRPTTTIASAPWL